MDPLSQLELTNFAIMPSNCFCMMSRFYANSTGRFRERKQQGNQNCDNGESHEAEKRPTEPDESTARHQGGMDD